LAVGEWGESEILIRPLRAVDQSPVAHEQALDEVAHTASDFFIFLTFDAPVPTPGRAERSLARKSERRDTESGSFLQAMGSPPGRKRSKARSESRLAGHVSDWRLDTLTIVPRRRRMTPDTSGGALAEMERHLARDLLMLQRFDESPTTLLWG